MGRYRGREAYYAARPPLNVSGGRSVCWEEGLATWSALPCFFSALLQYSPHYLAAWLEAALRNYILVNSLPQQDPPRLSHMSSFAEEGSTTPSS